MTRELEAALKWARTELQNRRRTASYVSIPRDWLRELVAAVRRAKMCPHGEWPAECLTCLDDHAEEAAAFRAQAEGGTVPRAAADVMAERQRQIENEGWSAEHDDAHSNRELATAAACYAAHAAGRYQNVAPSPWPWGVAWWKPADARRDLVKAGALILAEIERLDRAAPRAIEKMP